MKDFADKQTLDDLNLLGRYRKNSVLHLFNHSVTEGGKRLMEQLFQHPLSDPSEINKRTIIFQYFTKHEVAFPFSGEEFGIMENYLTSGESRNSIAAATDILLKKTLKLATGDKGFELLTTEVVTTISLLNRFAKFIYTMEERENPLLDKLNRVKELFRHPDLKWLNRQSDTEALPLAKLINYNYRMRGRLQEELKSLITFILELDVYIAVGRVAASKGFSYARALPKEDNRIKAEGLFHPALANAIGNTLELHRQQNVIFLTGANMAGKSTLMKSFGIALYLAHMGFPVAAQKMEFSVKDALYSSVNVPDNIALGYSHFYAEVLRVKAVAEAVAADKDLYVIFDELFKGTNVKDAYDATLAITEAFSENQNCFFIVSTHITEVGETLQKRGDNFRFTYLPTVMDGIMPTYTYKLAEGITTDRHGMMIIENEGILDLLGETCIQKN